MQFAAGAAPPVSSEAFKLLSIIAEGCGDALAEASHKQAAISLQRALQALVLEHDKKHLADLHASLFSSLSRPV